MVVASIYRMYTRHLSLAEGPGIAIPSMLLMLFLLSSTVVYVRVTWELKWATFSQSRHEDKPEIDL